MYQAVLVSTILEAVSLKTNFGTSYLHSLTQLLLTLCTSVWRRKKGKVRQLKCCLLLTTIKTQVTFTCLAYIKLHKHSVSIDAIKVLRVERKST